MADQGILWESYTVRTTWYKLIKLTPPEPTTSHPSSCYSLRILIQTRRSLHDILCSWLFHNPTIPSMICFQIMTSDLESSGHIHTCYLLSYRMFSTTLDHPITLVPNWVDLDVFAWRAERLKSCSQMPHRSGRRLPASRPRTVAHPAPARTTSSGQKKSADMGNRTPDH